MTTPDPAATKSTLRRMLRARRRLIPAAEAAAAAAAVATRLLDLLVSAGVPCGGSAASQVIAGYWPLGSELDLRPALAALHHAGLTCTLPLVVGRDQPLEFRHWTPATQLVPGAHGAWMPPSSAAVLRPTLLLVPVLGFDHRGGRLGQGGGYYDRTLDALRGADQPAPVPALGIAYACQALEQVPLGPHDQRLDAIVTELGMIPCGAIPCGASAGGPAVAEGALWRHDAVNPRGSTAGSCG